MTFMRLKFMKLNFVIHLLFLKINIKVMTNEYFDSKNN